MKALTICQPFAHLIVTPQSELPSGQVHKVCENRTWETFYRGPLLIHAGKSREWLTEANWPHLCSVAGGGHSMQFGMIVGVAWLEDCFAARRQRNPVSGETWLECAVFYKRKYQQQFGLSLDAHVHCEGPFCWMLGTRRRFAEPIKYSGAQGLFDVPEDERLREQLVACGFPEKLWTPTRPKTSKPKFAKGPAF